MEGGGSSEKVVIGHCDAQMHEDIEMDIDYYLNIINQGAFVEFDLFGWHEFMSDQERFKRIAILTSAGFTDQILISTDTCRKSQLYHFGGRGFDYLFTHIIPGLLEYGLSMKEIDQITKINPLGILSLTQS
jgi:phosphotriesterase-related protein